jgi:hypothetical protein
LSELKDGTERRIVAESCRKAVFMRRGPDFVGKPEGWGKQETDDYIANHYHKVSDEIKLGWDLTGAVEDYRLYFQLGYRIAQGERWPAWKPGDEFKAKRDECLTRPDDRHPSLSRYAARGMAGGD